MNSFRESLLTISEERNVALIIENKKIWVSKEVLSMASPVFKNLFYGDFKERNQDCIELPGKKFEDVLELMCCLFLYPGQKRIDSKNADIVVPLADEYDIDCVKVRCEFFFEDKIKNGGIGSDEVLRILKTAIKYHYKEVAKICIRRTAAVLIVSQIMELKRDLPRNVIAALLEAKANRLELEKAKHRISETDDQCESCDDGYYDECEKCDLTFCNSCKKHTKYNVCPFFHGLDCPNRKLLNHFHDCECGFIFDDEWLNF